MIIKKDLELLDNTPNYTDFSKSVIDGIAIPGGANSINTMLRLFSSRISHFTKDVVLEVTEKAVRDNSVVIADMKNYILPVLYNKKSGQIIINLKYFSVKDISRVDHKDIYACMVYGITMAAVINKVIPISVDYSRYIAAFMSSILMRLFGKDYGLLGAYNYNIDKLRFIMLLYVMIAFFGQSQGETLFKKAGQMVGFDYGIDQFDFNSLDLRLSRNLVEMLHKSDVMPGINIYSFTNKLMKYFEVSFIPFFDDLSRHIASVAVSDLGVNNIVRSFYTKYNRMAFSRLLSIVEQIFMRLGKLK